MEELNKTTHKTMGLIKHKGHENCSSQLKAQRSNHQKGPQSRRSAGTMSPTVCS